MLNNPFISIITASFNNAQTIRKTLESIKNQTFENVEHIIIDNCSTDGTLDTFREFENSYNMSWISEPDNGISEALNKGLKKAKGQYILIIHADDYLISNDILSRAYDSLKYEKYDLVSFPIMMEFPYKKMVCLSHKPLWQYKIQTVLRHQGTFVHKRLHNIVGIYSTKYLIGMDYDFFYRSFLKNASIKLENTAIAVMDSRGIGTKLEFKKKRILENYKIQCENEKSTILRLLQFLFFQYRKNIRPQLIKLIKNHD